MSEIHSPSAVVWDVGRVLIQWDLRCLFGKMIDDPEELEWFVSNVVTERWHHQQDEGRSLSEMVPERIAQYPQYAEHIRAYATRFNETIPGHVPGTHDLVVRLHARGVRQFGLTNFGDDFWPLFRPTEEVFDVFEDVVVSGTEKVAKPDPAIYALAETRFGLPPSALFFIDDKAENIAAAKARGWHGHVFEDAAKLEADLTSRGLLD
ncbi:HAD family hydrolase [Aurantiacibacter sediminis]|uniref:HAD family phosphatase n=1 Tax=Aurantiacibacter sediminis TaxID=2793064 RepID=A0ABS0N205_9SPHN|nr:HAD family phosphatase [Aurantiacibacter sediminis]MBH5321059.1 HAD family phosphatase [Aurantiacibacter sediminis]